MSPLLAILQVVVVAAGSAAVLAFLISNIKYRNLELLAEQELSSGKPISPSALVIELLKVLRKEQVLLCRIQTPDSSDNRAIAGLLEREARKGDVHTPAENGVSVSQFFCPPDHAQALGKRLTRILIKKGYDQGSIVIWKPDLDTESLLTWILKGDGHQATGPWRLTVDVPEAESQVPEASEESSSIDPVTGVFREDRVSRAIRRRLAARSRVKKPGTMVRIAVTVPEDLTERDAEMKKAADLLMSHCRERDLIGRSGEAEFVLCMDGDRQNLELAARRILAALRSEGCDISMGLSAMPDHGDSPGQLFERAGLALEAAHACKEGHVYSFDPEMEAQPDTGETGSFGREEF